MQSLDRYWREHRGECDPCSGCNSCRRTSKACSGGKIAYQYEVNYFFKDIDRSDIDKNRKAKGLENNVLHLPGGKNKGDVKWNHLARLHTLSLSLLLSISRTEMRNIFNCSVTFQNFLNVYLEFEESRSLKSWIQSRRSKVDCFRIFVSQHWIECSHLLFYIMEGNSIWRPSWLK